MRESYDHAQAILWVLSMGYAMLQTAVMYWKMIHAANQSQRFCPAVL